MAAHLQGHSAHCDIRRWAIPLERVFSAWPLCADMAGGGGLGRESWSQGPGREARPSEASLDGPHCLPLNDPASPASFPPYVLVTWAVVGMAVDIGLARFTYGVTLAPMASELGLDHAAAGAINALHLLGYLVGTVAFPALLVRLPGAVLARVGHLVFAVGAAACAMAPGVATLAAGRLVSGLGAAAGISALFTLTLEAVEPSRRTAVSAAIWSGVGFAVAASGLAAPLLLLGPEGWRIGFAASSAVALCVSVCFPPPGWAARRPAAELAAARGAERLPPGWFLGRRWVFLIGAYSAFGLAYIALVTFTGTRLAASGASSQVVQAVWTCLGTACIAGSAMSAAAVGRLSARRAALAVGMASCAAGSLVSAVGGVPAALAGACLFGLGMTSAPAMVTAYLRERSTAATYPRAFGVATAGLGLGQLAGPVAAGLLSDRYGPAAPPMLAAAAFAAATALAVLDEAFGARPPRDERMRQTEA